ncbi:MAG: 3-methyl-2-oxobutanoate hydroxymethyltransferase [Gaiellales bacterium]|nr:3-methyl-2-oxobutanoate hydroxymethyltransferase [Gaiellales bacterium]
MKLSLPDLRQMKRDGRPIVMITAYDHPTGRIVDEVGVDIVLVGDSAANNVLGLDSTVPATMDQMTMLTAAVSRGVARAIVVGDLPFMSYQVSDEEAVRNGGRLVKEGGADVVKLEGAGPMLDRVKALVAAGIPVMGHLGLTPQTATSMGGHKAQGRERDTARQLYLAAIALQDAGCFALVLEAVAPQVAAAITRRLSIPTIGIGSGADTDGQVLVLHDVLGINGPGGHRPRFVKRYAEIGEAIGDAVRTYAEEVRDHQYPAPEHAYTMPDEEVAAFERAIDAGSIEENVLADW